MARWICLWGSTLLMIARAIGEDSGDNAAANVTHGDPPPAHSMHRLIPSVMDMSSDPTGNSSQLLSPANVSDSVPFLPVGVTAAPQSVRSLHKDFTPSYFIGEVIAEPYVPERFQSANSDRSKRNSTNRSYQAPIASQTALAFNKILPFFEKMKETSFNQLEGNAYNYVPPVHEISEEEEEATTPKYMVNYGDQDEHSDRPNRHPYKFQPSIFSTKPITFDDIREASRFEMKNPQETHGYSDNYHHHDQRSNHESYHGHLNSHGSHQGHMAGYQESYGGGVALGSHSLKGHDISSIPSEPYYDDYLHHHGSHDFVLPSPFYPPGPGPAPDHHNHKGVLYNVFQNKHKGGLQGLFHLAATLLPLGLLFAALQPSVLQVNSSQTMPMRQRSLDSLEPESLQVLERLQRLDVTDCRERALFCEEAVKGAEVDASSILRALWKISTRLPQEVAVPLGLAPVLRAVRERSCAAIACGVDHPRTNSTGGT